MAAEKMMPTIKKVRRRREGVSVCLRAASFIHLEKAAYMLAIKNKSLNLSADSLTLYTEMRAAGVESTGKKT
jgi:hypothetical protein